jgi:hypothetical protein
MGTKKLSVTLPEQTVEWLEERYPDAKSDSERVAFAVKDARDLDRLLGARKVTEVNVDSLDDLDSMG